MKRPERLCEVLRFFNSQEGDTEIENMVHIMGGMGGPKTSEGAVFHIQDAQ